MSWYKKYYFLKKFISQKCLEMSLKNEFFRIVNFWLLGRVYSCIWLLLFDLFDRLRGALKSSSLLLTKNFNCSTIGLFYLLNYLLYLVLDSSWSKCCLKWLKVVVNFLCLSIFCIYVDLSLNYEVKKAVLLRAPIFLCFFIDNYNNYEKC